MIEIDLLNECQRLLSEVNISTSLVEAGQFRALAFEGSTVLGFLVAYETPVQLLDRWDVESTLLINRHRLSLRRASSKAWNTYAVFIARSEANAHEKVALGSIEEDLSGTRKIARAGISDARGVRGALLPLLPIQNAPRLEAVDMTAEIRLRTSELPSRVVDAFLSGAQETTVAQVLEEEP